MIRSRVTLATIEAAATERHLASPLTSAIVGDRKIGQDLAVHHHAIRRDPEDRTASAIASKRGPDDVDAVDHFGGDHSDAHRDRRRP